MTMTMSRRVFGLGALATMPLLMGLASSRSGGLQVGIQTFSFRDMLGQPGDMIDNMIMATKELGLDLVELFEPTILPLALVKESMSSPQMQAAIYARSKTPVTDAQQALREKFRAWRLETPTTHFTAIRRRFEAAGIRIQAFNFALNDYCTDAELERGFAITRALGTDLMTVSMTTSMAKRCVPFAEKSHVRLGLHGHTNVDDPNEFSSPESFAAGLALSPLYFVNLDIGHFSAAGFDPVAYLEKNHTRICSVHIKDRKNHKGPAVTFGEGDTPIGPVVRLIRDRRWDIPAMLEYEYEGGPSTPALRSCLAYVRAALAPGASS